MKAIIVDKEGKLHLENVNTPTIKHEELLIEIVASGFNPIDYQMLESELERKLMHSPILGREFSGIVVGIGALVMWKYILITVTHPNQRILLRTRILMFFLVEIMVLI